jgi:hypothetical protein
MVCTVDFIVLSLCGSMRFHDGLYCQALEASKIRQYSYWAEYKGTYETGYWRSASRVQVGRCIRDWYAVCIVLHPTWSYVVFRYSRSASGYSPGMVDPISSSTDGHALSVLAHLPWMSVSNPSMSCSVQFRAIGVRLSHRSRCDLRSHMV